MATSKVSICSNALLLVGDETIASFDESTSRARLVSNLWEDIRRATLRMHPWNFARRRVLLAPLATAPAFDWSYAFQLPGDWLRTVSIGEREEFDEFEMEDGKILCDLSSIKLRYIYDHDNVAAWDALFVEAATFHMASAIAYPITKSASMQESMKGMLAGVLQLARAVNGQEYTGDRLGDEPLRSSRY